MDEFNKILHIINLIDLIRDLSAEIVNEDFRSIMDEMMSDDLLTETKIELNSSFHE